VPSKSTLLLRAVHEEPLSVCLLELLLAWLACAATKDQLTPQLPAQWDVPVRSGLLVDDGVVVLQVGAEALGLERDPQSILVHGVGVLRPVAKVVGIEGELLAQVFDGFGVFVEEDLGGLCQWWGLDTHPCGAIASSTMAQT
jgi:hypothetical protein